MNPSLARYRDPAAKLAYDAAWVRNKRSNPAVREQENEAARLRMKALYAARKRQLELVTRHLAIEARLRSSRARRVAAIQMRLHQVAPDGDINAFRERLLAAMPERVG